MVERRRPNVDELVAEWASAHRRGSSEESRLRHQLPGEAFRVTARSFVYAAWECISAAAQPYSNGLATRRQEEVPQIISAARQTSLVAMKGRKVCLASEVAELDELLTEEFAAAALEDEARRRQVVANDPRILTQVEIDQTHGKDVLVVQHKATAIRARFTISRTRPGFGHVLAKAHEIGTIDTEPTLPQLPPEMFFGLGVGRLIYREAARLRPGTRWRSLATTPAASGLRCKLHREDPWTWQLSSCEWCNDKKIDWETAAKDTFVGHPPSAL